jgi:hypothetical protein
VTEWIWEVPGTDQVLEIRFSQEKAAWACFKSRYTLDER